MIIVPNRSTSVRSVHRPQAIVIHVSSENLCRLHGTTIDTIPYERDWKQVTCAHSTCTFFTSLPARGAKNRLCACVLDEEETLRERDAAVGEVKCTG